MLYVKWERVQANPWQTRKGVDTAYVAGLAADIEGRRKSRPLTKGLLQAPAGRAVDLDGAQNWEGLNEAQVQHLVDQGDAVIQLAYGHNRWAAFQLLAATSFGTDEDEEYYTTLPVELVWFDDEEMATSAWAENYQRRDLTAMEKAYAILAMMDTFDWSQKEVGERLGLSRPVVSNSLRLLRLPVGMQEQVQKGQMSERQALAVLPLAELPAAARESVPDHHWYSRQARAVLENPANFSSDEIRDIVERFEEKATGNLAEAVFPLDWPLPDADGVRAAACTDCDHKMKRKGGDRCQDPGCLQVRTFAWLRAEMAPIAAEVGLPFLDPEEAQGLEYGQVTSFYGWSEDGKETLEYALANGCERLHIAYRPVGSNQVPVSGHERALYLCVRKSGERCKCQGQVKKAAQAEVKAADRKRQAAVRKVKKAALAQVETAIEAGETGVLRVQLVEMSGWGKKEEYRAIEERERIVQQVAKILVDRAFHWADFSGAEAEVKWAAWAEGLGIGESGGEVEGSNGSVELTDIRRRWERVRGWIEEAEAAEEGPELVAIEGNVQNLERLVVELGPMETEAEGDEVTALALEIGGGLCRLERMLAVE